MFTDSRINIFMAVVEQGSFTRAAASLGITQPAVSQNVAEMEKELSVRLFERKKGSVELTPEGVRFKRYAEQILYWYKVADEAFGGLPETLRIGRREPRELRIGISDAYRCLLLPGPDPDADINIGTTSEGGLSVTVIQKVAEPSKRSATELF